MIEQYRHPLRLYIHNRNAGYLLYHTTKCDESMRRSSQYFWLPSKHESQKQFPLPRNGDTGYLIYALFSQYSGTGFNSTTIESFHSVLTRTTQASLGRMPAGIFTTLVFPVAAILIIILPVAPGIYPLQILFRNEDIFLDQFTIDSIASLFFPRLSYRKPLRNRYSAELNSSFSKMAAASRYILAASSFLPCSA